MWNSMGAAFVLTTQSPTVLMHPPLANTWVIAAAVAATLTPAPAATSVTTVTITTATPTETRTVTPVVNVTRTLAATIATVMATAEMVGMLATGATAARRLPDVATPRSTEGAGATRGAPRGAAAPTGPGITKHPRLAQPLPMERSHAGEVLDLGTPARAVAVR